MSYDAAVHQMYRFSMEMLCCVRDDTAASVHSYWKSIQQYCWCNMCYIINESDAVLYNACIFTSSFCKANYIRSGYTPVLHDLSVLAIRRTMQINSRKLLYILEGKCRFAWVVRLITPVVRIKLHTTVSVRIKGDGLGWGFLSCPEVTVLVIRRTVLHKRISMFFAI